MRWLQDPSQSNVDNLNSVDVKLVDNSKKKRRRNISELTLMSLKIKVR
jgi:hypothetical protein